MIRECSPLPMPESVPAHSDPSSLISPDAWQRLESATLSVVHRIQPTISSEHLRTAVIDYVQRLFKVLPFGSVPLKTYLPDGDIDLTLFDPAISDENLENDVYAILKSEEQSKDSEFEVNAVQFVPAEVKLVKCRVQNIDVDISVNQIGGLYTVHFLEKVNKKFGKNHLFRRSIMLIKDWCYYEACILGSHRGFICTYALETLVLYIFHIFYNSLDGPLAVLYRFLDYYSKFDWNNKGISLFGPISLSSLPELVTEPPDTNDEGFLLREEFLKEWAEAFTVTFRNCEKNPQVFSRKFLNIVDPLNQSNNLGRSVRKKNFDRIRSAFDIGARKLRKILQVPACFVIDGINRFFSNTVIRPVVLISCFDDVLLMTDHVTNDSMAPILRAERGSKCSSSNNSYDVLSDQFSNFNISDSNNHGSVKQNECDSLAEHKEIK
ncbi:unnamed protein product [Urochloa decumbens]|uniref:PAP-associated domain-containing protein n=1 Tax=Urochloa decumbens TaxID=240449 RepID=A0ABC9FQV1_9POAL